jgi:hypothetical protein
LDETNLALMPEDDFATRERSIHGPFPKIVTLHDGSPPHDDDDDAGGGGAVKARLKAAVMMTAKKEATLSATRASRVVVKTRRKKWSRSWRSSHLATSTATMRSRSF